MTPSGKPVCWAVIAPEKALATQGRSLLGVSQGSDSRTEDQETRPPGAARRHTRRRMHYQLGADASDALARRRLDDLLSKD
jgi:hypothetical protein